MSASELISNKINDDIVESMYERFSECINSRGLLNDLSSLTLLFSCGKDCSVLLDLILRYFEENSFNIDFSVFSVLYPIHMYYYDDGTERKVVNEIREYWLSRGIDIKFVLPDDLDIDSCKSSACKQCKKVRKAIIDPYVNSQVKKTGILTGFSIFDALAYLDMFLLNCGYDISKICDLPDDLKRTSTKMLHKISLREYLPTEKYMIRPLLIFNDIEIISYLKEKQIPYNSVECMAYRSKFKRKYAQALSIHGIIPNYEDIECFFDRNGIVINNNGLSFDDVVTDNYFVDC